MTMQVAETTASLGRCDMDVLTAIKTRSSALRLSEPGPTPEHIAQLLEACAASPDHGRLRPWRFVVISGEARRRLGRCLAELRLRKVPNSTEVALAGEREKAMRAPVIIAVAAHVTTGGKVPDVEQIIATGAGVQNMFLAAHALGYGAMWKTGDAAYDDEVKAAIGLSREDHIVAFLYVGSIAASGPAKSRSLEGLVSWLDEDQETPAPPAA